ncbi:hypothetical protein [Staphylococcus sp. 11261D007BR]
MNEYIISRNLSKSQTTLYIIYKNNVLKNDVQFKNLDINTKDIAQVHFIFESQISQGLVEEVTHILNELENETIIKVTFKLIQNNDERLYSILNTMSQNRIMNIYYFDKGYLITEFLGYSQKQLNKNRNAYLIDMIKKEMSRQKEVPVYSEQKLKQELLLVKQDYEELYATYHRTHKRMQFAFRELHKFKRSAWKYKKKYIENQHLIDSIEKISSYKKRVNKRNLRKLVKLIVKKVKK